MNKTMSQSLNDHPFVVIPSASPLCIFRPELVKKLFCYLGQLDEAKFEISELNYVEGSSEYIFHYPDSLVNEGSALQFFLMVEEFLRTKTFEEICKAFANDGFYNDNDGSPFSPVSDVNSFIWNLKTAYGTQVESNVEDYFYYPHSEEIWDVLNIFKFEGIPQFEIVVRRQKDRVFGIIPNVGTDVDVMPEPNTMDEILSLIDKQVSQIKVRSCAMVARLLKLLRNNNIFSRVVNNPGRTLTIQFIRLAVNIDFDARSGPSAPEGVFTLIELHEDGREAIRSVTTEREVLTWVLEQSSEKKDETPYSALNAFIANLVAVQSVRSCHFKYGELSGQLQSWFLNFTIGDLANGSFVEFRTTYHPKGGFQFKTKHPDHASDVEHTAFDADEAFEWVRAYMLANFMATLRKHHD